MKLDPIKSKSKEPHQPRAPKAERPSKASPRFKRYQQGSEAEAPADLDAYADSSALFDLERTFDFLCREFEAIQEMGGRARPLQDLLPYWKAYHDERTNRSIQHKETTTSGLLRRVDAEEARAFLESKDAYQRVRRYLSLRLYALHRKRALPKLTPYHPEVLGFVESIRLDGVWISVPAPKGGKAFFFQGFIGRDEQDEPRVRPVSRLRVGMPLVSRAIIASSRVCDFGRVGCRGPGKLPSVLRDPRAIDVDPLDPCEKESTRVYRCRDCMTCMMCGFSPLIEHDWGGCTWQSPYWTGFGSAEERQGEQKGGSTGTSYQTVRWETRTIEVEDCWSWQARQLQRSLTQEGKGAKVHAVYPAWLVENRSPLGRASQDDAKRVLCWKCHDAVRAAKDEDLVLPTATLEPVEVLEPPPGSDKPLVGTPIRITVSLSQAPWVALLGAPLAGGGAAPLDGRALEFGASSVRLVSEDLHLDRDVKFPPVAEPEPQQVTVTIPLDAPDVCRIRLEDPRHCTLARDKGRVDVGREVEWPEIPVHGPPKVMFSAEGCPSQKPESGEDVYAAKEKVPFHIEVDGSVFEKITGRVEVSCPVWSKTLSTPFTVEVAGTEATTGKITLEDTKGLKAAVTLHIESGFAERAIPYLGFIEVRAEGGSCPPPPTPECDAGGLKIYEIHAESADEVPEDGTEKAWKRRGHQPGDYLNPKVLGVFPPGSPQEPSLVQVIAGKRPGEDEEVEHEYHTTHLVVEVPVPETVCDGHPSLEVYEVAEDGTETLVTDLEAKVEVEVYDEESKEIKKESQDNERRPEFEDLEFGDPEDAPLMGEAAAGMKYRRWAMKVFCRRQEFEDAEVRKREATLKATLTKIFEPIAKGISPEGYKAVTEGLDGDTPRRFGGARVNCYRIVVRACGQAPAPAPDGDADAGPPTKPEMTAETIVHVFPSHEYKLRFVSPTYKEHTVCEGGTEREEPEEVEEGQDADDTEGELVILAPTWVAHGIDVLDPERVPQAEGQELAAPQLDDRMVEMQEHRSSPSFDREREFNKQREFENLDDLKKSFKDWAKEYFEEHVTEEVKKDFPEGSGLSLTGADSLGNLPAKLTASFNRVVEGIWKSIDVWNTIQGLIPSFGFGFRFEVKILEGTFNWRWGFKEYKDYRVYAWQERDVLLTLAMVNVRFHVGFTAGAWILKIEAIVYGLVSGELQYTKWWQSLPPGNPPLDPDPPLQVTYKTMGNQVAIPTASSPPPSDDDRTKQAAQDRLDRIETQDAGEPSPVKKTDDGWFGMIAKAEIGVNLILLHESLLHANAAGRSGYHKQFRFNTGPVGLQYQSFFLGVTFFGKFKIIGAKARTKEFVLIEEDPPGFPRSFGTLPSDAVKGWDGVREYLLIASRECMQRQRRLRSAAEAWMDAVEEIVLSTVMVSRGNDPEEPIIKPDDLSTKLANALSTDKDLAQDDGRDALGAFDARQRVLFGRPLQLWQQAHSRFREEKGWGWSNARPARPRKIKTKLEYHRKWGDKRFKQAKANLEELVEKVTKIEAKISELNGLEAAAEETGGFDPNNPDHKAMLDACRALRKEVRAIEYRTISRKLTARAEDILHWAKNRTMTSYEWKTPQSKTQLTGTSST